LICRAWIAGPDEECVCDFDGRDDRGRFRRIKSANAPGDLCAGSRGEYAELPELKMFGAGVAFLPGGTRAHAEKITGRWRIFASAES